jgi:cytochrome c-type biogenesis protein CcmE
VCFIKKSTVETYCGVDMYIHVILTAALDSDIQFTSTSDSYLPAKKEQRYVQIMRRGVRVRMEGLVRERSSGSLGVTKHFRPDWS